MKVYNIVLDTQKEKYAVIELLRRNNIQITNISGYFDGYIIHFLYNGDTQLLDNKIQNTFIYFLLLFCYNVLFYVLTWFYISYNGFI